MESDNAAVESARREVAAEEKKLNAGQPNNYRKAYDRFCEAQRAAEKNAKG